MRNLLTHVIAIIVLSLLWFGFRGSRSAAVSPPAAAASPRPFSPFTPTLVPTPTPNAAELAAAAVTPAVERTPEIEVGDLMGSLRDYRNAFGANPVGNNAEITSALLGENPRNLAFVERASAKLNAQGEMIDRWGRPYFFHAITAKFIEVRSAGPDGVLYTPDDIVGE